MRRNENTAFSRKKSPALHYICSAGLFGPLASLCLYLSRSALARAHLSACLVACCVSRAKSPSLSLSSLRLYATPRISVRTPASERPESVQPPRQGVHRV